MTEEERQEERVERRRSNKLWTYIAFGAVAGGFCLMALSASWVVVRSANERQQICMAALKERDVLRDVIKFARDSALNRATDSTERGLIHEFYNGALAKAPEVKCSNGSIERR